ncbi:PASTA domain-containing protein [Pseudofrankia asymbiotica]|uniref:PASTA domain-containing protein n=1 Tax=Pseudofrankia asymbiotica TaxID=1834516 RepID=A0A1V2IJC3_9ACTN|nr:PASTA domain-containing protein [Pseudofrankia asymbiotica]ONH33312.1 hypothetical protein BL253_01615 [Pseudofrankia asymbiotica]
MAERERSDAGDAAVDRALAELADLAGPAPALLPRVRRRAGALRRRRGSAIGAGVVATTAATVAVVLAAGTGGGPASADREAVAAPVASDTTTATPAPATPSTPGAVTTTPVPTSPATPPRPTNSTIEQPLLRTSVVPGPLDEPRTTGTTPAGPAQTTPVPLYSPPVVTVPNVTGVTVPDAKRTLDEAGFDWVVLDGCTEADVTARVVGQDPGPGASLNIYYKILLRCAA